jgi:sugar phosphate isomerase/epimerase
MLAVENHNHKGFVKTADEALRVIKEVNSDWVRLNLDSGGYLDGYPAIEKIVNLAIHIHAKFYDINERGSDRTLNYNRIFDILSRKNYRGFVSIEYEGKEDEFSAIPRIVRFLKQFK